MTVMTHPREIIEVRERMLQSSKAVTRTIQVGSANVQIIETGEGPPLVLLHGTNGSASFLLPLLERLSQVRAVAVDRPGFGLSDPLEVAPERFRQEAVAWIERTIDALGLDEPSLLGSSMGGTWASWFALAHPDRIRRLILLGAPPLFPGTRPPFPLRVASAPVFGDLLSRVKPSPTMVKRMMASMGEKDTIVHHPDQIEALVAAGRDPVAARANLAELRAAMTPAGFRSHMRIRTEELQQLRIPTLLVWGSRDPVGSVETARAIGAAIPQARLEVVPTGHGPWLGHAEGSASLIEEFLLGSDVG